MSSFLDSSSLGIYIAFEGIDGCGKSTQYDLFTDWLKLNHKEREIVLTREPGGTQIAEQIRDVLLKKGLEPMDFWTEACLFAAARAQTIRNVVAPALERGAIIVSDRSIWSSVAYQGFGRELGRNRVLRLNEESVDGIIPDLVYYFRISPEEAEARIGERVKKDRLDEEDDNFNHRVVRGFELMASKLMSFRTIDGTKSPEEQFETVKEIFKERFTEGREGVVSRERGW